MVAIPVSLIGAFFVMYLMNFSINVLTAGHSAATGLVVDDAIVVVENIYSKIEAGLDPEGQGMREPRRFFAIVSTTITLVSVFMHRVLAGDDWKAIPRVWSCVVGAVSYRQ